jgi:hypothetical protein
LSSISIWERSVGRNMNQELLIPFVQV